MISPYELREKWRLTNYQLARALGREEQTIKSYMAREGTNSHRKPSLTVLMLCDARDKEWSLNGVPKSFSCYQEA